MLHLEWLLRLEELVGLFRAVQLDRLARIDGPNLPEQPAPDEAEWIFQGRHTNDLRIEVITETLSDGSRSQGVTTAIPTPNGYQTNSYRRLFRIPLQGVPTGEIPRRWQHLLTPEMLKPVEPPAAF